MSASAITPRSISDIAWLLARSRLVIWFLIAFLAPGLLVAGAALSTKTGMQIVIISAFVERFLQLLVIGKVYQDGARMLQPPRQLHFLPRFFVVGFAIELVITSGAFLMVALPGLGTAVAAICLFFAVRTIVSIILYPMPYMDPLLSAKEALVASKALTSKISLSHLTLWPLAIFLIGSGLAFAQFPDGRLWWSAPVTQALAGLCHLIFVFRGAAAAMLAAGLHYKPNARQTFGSPLVLVISGFALWGANLIRAYTLPPGPQIVVTSAIAAPQTVTVTLDATDENYSFKGFTPQRFFIGGATGYPVTNAAPQVQTAEDGDSNKKITLIFKTERPPNELVEIEDLHLWYGAVQVTPMIVTQE